MEEYFIKAYWKKSIRYIAILVTIWFLISFSGGILFKDFLNQYHIGSAELGQWFAQKGSFYSFLICLIIIAKLVTRLDKKYSEKD